MALELVPITTMSVKLRSDIITIAGGALGTRVIAEVEEATLAGDRLNGTMLGQAAADWLTLGPDGSYGTLDVRAAFRTDDGDDLYITYGGKIDLASQHAVSAPLFETGAESLMWLNRIQAVGDGAMNADGLLVYELYEVRQV